MDLFQLATLLVQIAILATLAWYGRKIVQSLTASPDLTQAPDLARAAVTNEVTKGVSQQVPQNEAHEPEMLVPSYFTPRRAPAREPAVASEDARRSQDQAGGNPGLLRGLIGWLQEPMTFNRVSPWRRMIVWFQSPVGS